MNETARTKRISEVRRNWREANNKGVVMNKPKKVKTYKSRIDCQDLRDNSCNQGYNIAIRDRDNWLKEIASVENIEKAIYATEGIYTISHRPASGGAWARKVNKIAKAIHNLFK